MVRLINFLHFLGCFVFVCALWWFLTLIYEFLEIPKIDLKKSDYRGTGKKLPQKPSLKIGL